MRRDDLIAMLAEFVGPVGPLGSVDDHFQQRDDRIAGADFDDVDLLVDLLLHPPKLAPVYTEEGKWDSAVVDSLITWGRRDPARTLPKIGPLLSNKALSPAVIRIIGGLRHPDGLRWLIPLVDSAAGLTEEERIALAGALGEIGGDDARKLVDRLRGVPNMTPGLQNEIDVASKASLCPPEQRSWFYGTLRETYEHLKGRTW